MPEHRHENADENRTHIETSGQMGLIISPEATLAENPGIPVKHPRILWIGPGNLFKRILEAGAFDDLLLKHESNLTVVGIRPARRIEYLPNHGNVNYFDVSDHRQRRDLVHNCMCGSNGLYTHCYVANWPDLHLLSAFQYSTLCANGDIVITKPLDLNVPLVKAVGSGAFPDICGRIIMDDHYRNKGCVRELHRIFHEIQESYGKLRGFRMWLVENKTIEEENRLRALECGVIWDLASHLFSIVQLFFLNFPYQGLIAYSNEGVPNDFRSIHIIIDKVLKMRYIHCQLIESVETLAVIEISIVFNRRTYLGSWHSERIKGLLVVGKAVSSAPGVDSSIKQLDFSFEDGTVNLDLNTSQLRPPLDNFIPMKEKGFYRPVVELLRHSYHAAKQDHSNFDRNENLSPGRYHPGMPCRDSCLNTILIRSAREHDSAKELIRAYHAKEPIRNILNELIGRGCLNKVWLDERKYSPIV